MVKSYKRSDKVQLSKNFRLDEFKCKCGKCDPILLDEKLVELLQKIRDHFGKSVNVNSGYRCPSHNASPKVGGNPVSHHMKGMAADIRVEGVTPAEVAKYAESIGIQRIGLYDTFVHIGSDPSRHFWKGHKSIPVETFGGKPATVSINLPILRKGVKCSEVRTLQQLLIDNGFNIVVDGSFGTQTESSLKCYQEDNDLQVDGVCGSATWKSMLGVE